MIPRYNEEPLLVPETESDYAQLARYHAIRTMRQRQSVPVYRNFHLTEAERQVIPQLVDGDLFGHEDHEVHHELNGATAYLDHLIQSPEYMRDFGSSSGEDPSATAKSDSPSDPAFAAEAVDPSAKPDPEAAQKASVAPAAHPAVDPSALAPPASA